MCDGGYRYTLPLPACHFGPGCADPTVCAPYASAVVAATKHGPHMDKQHQQANAGSERPARG